MIQIKKLSELSQSLMFPLENKQTRKCIDLLGYFLGGYL